LRVRDGRLRSRVVRMRFRSGGIRSSKDRLIGRKARFQVVGKV